MIVRELVTKLGFNIEASKLSRFDRDIGALKDKLGGVTRNLNRIGDSLIGVGGKLTLFVSTPLLLANVAAIKVASNMEQLAISFEVMLGSAEAGNKLIQEMFEFAAKTPFEIKNIGPVVKQLLAMGIESKKIIETLGFLGNVAAGLDVPIQRLALNLGQVKAQGRLTGRELRDFAIAGVPLLDELAKVTGKSKDELLKMVSAGEVKFPLVEQAFRNMSSEGGKFFNLMERQSKTLGGLFSNLMDNLYLTAGAYGEIVVETFQLKRAIGFLSRQMEKLLNWFKKLGKPMQTILIFFITFLTLIGPFLLILGLVIKGIAFLGSALLLLKTALGLATIGAAGFNVTMFFLPAIILAVVAALALLIDDIMTWVKGGDSLLGELLMPWEEWKEGMKTIFRDIKGAWEALIEGDLPEFLKKMQDALLGVVTFGLKGHIDKLAEENIESIAKEILSPQDFAALLEQGKRQAETQRITGDPEFVRRAGMANNPLGFNIPPVGQPIINTTVNVTTTGEGAVMGREIADVVEEVLDRKITETIATNQTP